MSTSSMACNWLELKGRVSCKDFDNCSLEVHPRGVSSKMFFFDRKLFNRAKNHHKLWVKGKFKVKEKLIVDQEEFLLIAPDLNERSYEKKMEKTCK